MIILDSFLYVFCFFILFSSKFKIISCEDVRDHINEILELGTRATGLMGTGAFAGEKVHGNYYMINYRLVNYNIFISFV